MSNLFLILAIIIVIVLVIDIFWIPKYMKMDVAGRIVVVILFSYNLFMYYIL